MIIVLIQRIHSEEQSPVDGMDRLERRSVRRLDHIDAPYGPGRVTPQRRLIAETASEVPGAFTTDELAAAVRAKDPAVGVATVYRAASALVLSGWLERVGERQGSALLARCNVSGGHHHHVVCDGCGCIEATPCPVVTLGPGSHPQSGPAGEFVITRHEVTLYGLCPACAAKIGSHRPTSDPTEPR